MNNQYRSESSHEGRSSASTDSQQPQGSGSSETNKQDQITDPQQELISNFVDKLPKDCALVVVDQRSREHNWIGYGPEDRHAKALLRSGGLTVRSIETLGDIAESLDSNLTYLKSELRKKSRSHLVTVASTLGSSFTEILEGARIPWTWSRRGGSAREALLSKTPYQEAIERDLAAVKEQTQRQARFAAQALYGNSDVYQRDTWKDVAREKGYFWRELVVLNDRRIIQVDSTAKISAEGRLEQGINAVDLGEPKSISIEGDTTRIQTSETQEIEIVIATERGRQTAGYRNAPVVLTLEDPVGPAMLMALIELGCNKMVRY